MNPSEDCIVYGIEQINDELYYLILAKGDYTPRLYHRDNFKVIDNHESSYWIADKNLPARKLFNDWLVFEDYLDWFFNGAEHLDVDEFEVNIEYFPYYQDLIENELNGIVSNEI
ncbi:hypothetical protein [Crocinitomix catalasitica]|uniref:hypothetical protein n=1 Tax=Crocinitomix catalasitica TaxID=184607 RepID=UPI00047F04B8|nr:hypothetical protein [Crocinitomix catalasitica]